MRPAARLGLDRDTRGVVAQNISSNISSGISSG